MDELLDKLRGIHEERTVMRKRERGGVDKKEREEKGSCFSGNPENWEGSEESSDPSSSRRDHHEVFDKGAV
jgi:hypothetical protein